MNSYHIPRHNIYDRCKKIEPKLKIQYPKKLLIGLIVGINIPIIYLFLLKIKYRYDLLCPAKVERPISPRSPLCNYRHNTTRKQKDSKKEKKKVHCQGTLGLRNNLMMSSEEVPVSTGMSAESGTDDIRHTTVMGEPQKESLYLLKVQSGIMSRLRTRT